MKGGCQ
jgi:hypothetical protein